MGWADRAAPAERLWWSGRGATAVVARSAATVEAGATRSLGSACVAVGALALSGLGLLGEAAGLTRPERSATRPRDAVRASPGSGADIVGGALAWWPAHDRDGRGSRPRIEARLAAGKKRRAKGDVAALEVRAAAGAGTWFARGALSRARPLDRGDPAGAVGFAARRGVTRFVGEIAGDRDGFRAGVDASMRDGPWRAEAHWRRRGMAARPTALDLEAAWIEPGAAARFRWRSWSARGAGSGVGGGDDGRAELDLRGGRGAAGGWSARLASKPRGGSGGGGERAAIGELIVARERSRDLRLTASTRALWTDGKWRAGRALGAAVGVGAGGRASLDLRVEAVRVEREGAAWSRGYEVAGSGSVRARSRTGVRLAARGWIRSGTWRLGAAVDDDDSGDGSSAGDPAPRANLWLTWNGGAGAP
jgi:hypothetical protein